MGTPLQKRDGDWKRVTTVFGEVAGTTLSRSVFILGPCCKLQCSMISRLQSPPCPFPLAYTLVSPTLRSRRSCLLISSLFSHSSLARLAGVERFLLSVPTFQLPTRLLRRGEEPTKAYIKAFSPLNDDHSLLNCHSSDIYHLHFLRHRSRSYPPAKIQISSILSSA